MDQDRDSAPTGASVTNDRTGIVVTRAQALFASWVSDVLVYVVVLELFVQYLPRVVTESFTVSILTAMVLKLLIVGIAGLEHHTRSRFQRHQGPLWRAFGLLTMFSILFISKFVVLEVIDIVFGDRVTLGGFIEVALLVVTMIAAQQGMTWIYRRLGSQNVP